MFFGGDPFSHGGGGGRSHRASRGGGAAVDTTKLYETLGVRLVWNGFFTLFCTPKSHECFFCIMSFLANKKCECTRYQKSIPKTGGEASSR